MLKIAIFEPPTPYHHALSRLLTRPPCIVPRSEQTPPPDTQQSRCKTSV